jgi:hypothetical protein
MPLADVHKPVRLNARLLTSINCKPVSTQVATRNSFRGVFDFGGERCSPEQKLQLLNMRRDIPE